MDCEKFVMCWNLEFKKYVSEHVAVVYATNGMY